MSSVFAFPRSGVAKRRITTGRSASTARRMARLDMPPFYASKCSIGWAAEHRSTTVAPPMNPPLAARRQPGSALCFVCGTHNPHGLGLQFFDDGKTVWTELTAAEHHQGWPGVLHGG